MKKLFALLITLILCFSLVACGNDKASDEKTTLILGFDAAFPPFGYVNEDGSYDGFDLALAREACKRLGWELKELPIKWEYKDAQLESGDINCIWNGFTYTGRETQYTWSEPYVDNSIVAVVKKDSGIKTLADLAGKKIMVQAASSACDAVNADEEFKNSLAEVIELLDYETGFVELAMGGVDAVMADLGVASYQIALRGGEYVALEEAVSTEQYAVGFKLGNEKMRDAIDKVLKEMAADGTMLKIAENYVDKGLVIESLRLIKDK